LSPCPPKPLPSFVPPHPWTTSSHVAHATAPLTTFDERRMSSSDPRTQWHVLPPSVTRRRDETPMGRTEAYFFLLRRPFCSKTPGSRVPHRPLRIGQCGIMVA